MSSNRSGGGPDHGDSASWASESIPLSVRRELLERELSKLGFRRSDARRGATANEMGGPQQDAQSSHPQADAESDTHGG